jgi:hypothetical protein
MDPRHRQLAEIALRAAGSEYGLALAGGYRVEVDARAETFARLLVAHSDDLGAEPQKVELAADWRAHPPVTLSIGPVLHPEDAVSNKMAALYGRALARDFLDIDAVLVSGRYSAERLLELAETADPGFDRAMFAQVLGALGQISDAAFAPYGVDAPAVRRLRQRFAAWQSELGHG